MRVAHVVAGLALRTGGIATAVVELARGLEEVGVETTIYSTDLGETAGARQRRPLEREQLPPGIEGLDVRIVRAAAPKRLAYVPSLRKTLRAELASVDILHVHGVWLYPTFAAGAEARRAGVPYVVSPHGMFDPALRGRGRLRKWLTTIGWQRQVLDHAACIHFVAGSEADLAADIAPQVRRVVVPNAIDFDEFSRGDGRVFRTRYLDGHDGPIVLNHGRIAEKKGLDILIRAFAAVVRDVPQALLVIAGPDDEGITDSLVALASDLGIGGRVRFVGMVTGRERSDALAAAQVWALPSRTEAWASAVTEALAAGTAVVLSPAVNSAVELGAMGAVRIVERDPVNLGSELVGLLQNKEARAALGERGRSAARRFDRASVGATMLEIYGQLLSGGQAAGAPIEPTPSDMNQWAVGS